MHSLVSVRAAMIKPGEFGPDELGDIFSIELATSPEVGDMVFDPRTQTYHKVLYRMISAEEIIYALSLAPAFQ